MLSRVNFKTKAQEGKEWLCPNFGHEHDSCETPKAENTDSRTNYAVKYATARGHLNQGLRKASTKEGRLAIFFARYRGQGPKGPNEAKKIATFSNTSGILHKRRTLKLQNLKMNRRFAPAPIPPQHLMRPSDCVQVSKIEKAPASYRAVSGQPQKSQKRVKEESPGPPVRGPKSPNRAW